jgi:uncharacterized membrane protein YbhN (UPF0104 family)
MLTSFPARAVITLVLLGLVAQSIDWPALGDAFEAIAWASFALVVVIFVATFVLAALRWQPLLTAAGIPSEFRGSQRAYFIGVFTNNALPTGFGGDVVRAWVVAGRGRSLARALTSVGVDRVSALGCLLVLGWVAVAIDPGAVPARLVGLLAIATGAGAALAVVAGALVRRGGLGRFLPPPLRPWWAEIRAVLRRYAADRRLQLRVLLLGLAFQAMSLLAFWLLADAVGIDIDAAVIAVVLPLVLIAMLAPISIAGFGVREGAFVVLLGEVGVSANDATLLSLLSVAAMTIASLPGGVALLIGHERPEIPSDALDPN